MTIETFKTEKRKRLGGKKRQNRISKHAVTTTKDVTYPYPNRITKRKKNRNAQKQYLKQCLKITPKLMPDTKPQIQEVQTTPERAMQKTPTPYHIIFKLQKIKYKEKILQEARRRKKTLPIEKNKGKNYIQFSSGTMQAKE